jgi:hypothetical protein
VRTGSGLVEGSNLLEMTSLEDRCLEYRAFWGGIPPPVLGKQELLLGTSGDVPGHPEVMIETNHQDP